MHMRGEEDGVENFTKHSLDEERLRANVDESGVGT